MLSEEDVKRFELGVGLLRAYCTAAQIGGYRRGCILAKSPLGFFRKAADLCECATEEFKRSLEGYRKERDAAARDLELLKQPPMDALNEAEQIDDERRMKGLQFFC